MCNYCDETENDFGDFRRFDDYNLEEKIEHIKKWYCIFTYNDHEDEFYRMLLSIATQPWKFLDIYYKKYDINDKRIKENNETDSK